MSEFGQIIASSYTVGELDDLYEMADHPERVLPVKVFATDADPGDENDNWSRKC